jgi:hypothetical protein
MQLLAAAGEMRIWNSAILVVVLIGSILLLAMRQTRISDRSKEK